MLQQLPTHARLPPWSLILADIGAPSAAAVGRALDVPASTAARWARFDAAPRPAMLALFWCTSWGRSELDSRMASELSQLAGLADCLRRERAEDARRLERLMALADFGAANAPILRA